ncbi:MAG TPA: putative lipid II flippase FtsW [Nitrospiraceae bacterium]|nr:putative lipid II flippase FtsW [Nitrospiraceae bacterium]
MPYSKIKEKDIVIPVFALVGIGILMVYSSTAVIAFKQFGDGFYYLKNHLFAVFLGFIAMIFLSRVNYQRLRPFVIPMLVISVILLLLVFVPHLGVSAGGAQRWLKLWSLTFQPSELAKIAMVIFLAAYMSKKQEEMKSLRYGLLIPVSIMGIFQGLFLIQPDFGGAISFGILTMCLLFVGGTRLAHILGFVLMTIPLIYKLILSVPYRMKRIKAFLDPGQDPLGSGFQLMQSFIAFGSGGLTGVGLGNSHQKLFFLPEAHTDFIFPLIGEELGFIGTVIVLSFFLWLFIKGTKIAMRSDNTFAYYLAIGLTLMIGIQTLINFAVSTGLIPTKGLPLPFISYGGSSLLVNMTAIGILINISRNSVHNPFSVIDRAKLIPPSSFTKVRRGDYSDAVYRPGSWMRFMKCG